MLRIRLLAYLYKGLASFVGQVFLRLTKEKIMSQRKFPHAHARGGESFPTINDPTII